MLLQAEVIDGGVLCWEQPCGSQLNFLGYSRSWLSQHQIAMFSVPWVIVFQIDLKHHLL